VDVGNNRQGRVRASAPQVELIRPTCSRAGLRDRGGGETTAADIAPYSLDARGRSVGSRRLAPQVGDYPVGAATAC
jgi:hypothetical protein